MGATAATTFAARLALDLSLALVGQGVFAPGRAEARQALGALHDGLLRQLRDAGQIALLGGRPSAPLEFFAWGFAPSRQPLDTLLPADAASLVRHLAGGWRDRRLVLLSLRNGITRQEFDLLFHLLAMAGDRGPALRKRYLEERARASLAHVALVFADDLQNLDSALPWPVHAALAWLQLDLNLLSRRGGAAPAAQATHRQALLDSVLSLVGEGGERRDLLAHLDHIVEQLHDYDRDEFAYLILGRVEPVQLAGVCLELCALLERLQQRVEQGRDESVHGRIEPVRWITRRVAEQLLDHNLATPAHFHALVLQKVLLYEEIPAAVRPRVAALQVLTSFLVNPQRYFTEIEASHSPEVLEQRLWRLLEMLPNMLRAYRFDAAREVTAFVQRFGPTFDLSRNVQLLAQVRETAAEVLATGDTAQQAELMKTLPQMGRTGLHLLIDLADHADRSVRRTALEGLCSSGQAVVPALFEALERKRGWHYLRNMLVILTRVGAGGPKVEALFLEGLGHAEAGIRKEALPGLARLLKESAAAQIAGLLNDPDPEVRRRAVVCLGLTGVADSAVYEQLAAMLSARSDNDLVLAVVGTINRLRPGPAAGPGVEEGLQQLAGGGNWFGLGRSQADRPLRIETVRALGQFPTAKTRKLLERLGQDNDAAVARAARDALAGGE